MLEQVLAAIVLLASMALLLRLLLPEARRRRLDAAAGRAWRQTRRALQRLWFWRRHRRHAAREADAAIRRAQGRAAREGSRSSRKLH